MSDWKADPTKVGVFSQNDSKQFVETVLQDFIRFAEAYDVNLDDEALFAIDYNDQTNIREFLKKNPQFYKKAIEKVSGQVSLAPFHRAFSHSFLDKTLQISEIYAEFKNLHTSKDIAEIRTKKFLTILQLYVDILSDIVKLELESKMIIGFALNVFVKNGFFNVIFANNSNNSRIKVLRNIRAHNNVITSAETWNSNCKTIGHVLREQLTIDEISKLTTDIQEGRRFVLFDKSDGKDGNPKVTFVLLEEPLLFLKKLITLCHILLYMLGLNNQVIVSRELVTKYWSPKYTHLSKLVLEELEVKELQQYLKDSRNKHIETTFKLPQILQ